MWCCAVAVRYERLKPEASLPGGFGSVETRGRTYFPQTVRLRVRDPETRFPPRLSKPPSKHLFAPKANPRPTPVPTLSIPEEVRDELLAHAREGEPEEVCGLLGGERDEATHRVETHHRAENVAETPKTRYEIGPREQLDLLERVEDAGREVVGFYHSHPQGPAEPSATDAQLATWPGRSYLLVSLGDTDRTDAPEVASWRWTGEEFVAEDLRVVADR